MTSAVAAADDVKTVKFNNQYAYGDLSVDGGTNVSTYGHMNAWGFKKQSVSITNIKLQRRGCGGHKWVTKLSNPSHHGFHVQSEDDGTTTFSPGRGWWRGVAVFAFKPRPGAPVKWKHKFTTPIVGNCHPVPPPSN